MSFFKAMAGAAIGVGAVAAAPFTGGGSLLGAATLVGSLTGVGTIAAAAGAGAVGAAVGAAMSSDSERRYQEGYREGQKEGRAKSEVELARMQQRLEAALARLDEGRRFFDALIAMEAVAIACANCDGEISAQERNDIQLFIKGISESAVPESVKEQIRKLYEQPPTLKQAYANARRSGVEMDLFDEIVEFVIHADGLVHDNEAAFLDAWNTLRRAA